MAIGLSPKHSATINSQDLTSELVLVATVDSIEKLEWDLVSLSDHGLVARTKFSMKSWSESVEVVFGEDETTISSECQGSQVVDWGKNKENVEAFVAKFKAFVSAAESIDVSDRLSEIKHQYNYTEVHASEAPLVYAENESGSFLDVIKPTKGYFVTPILILSNVAIFAIMVLNGVSFFEPDSESLLRWGANFRPATQSGEWWRLLSSCFLHIGVLHLLMNMYALMYIGQLLEPFLGKGRFLLAYILTGIAGSAASIYWSDFTVSAGASGAIFGMYGVFLAMLSTNLIDKSTRKSLLTSIGIFVAFNLMYGMKGGIDNAAHIGGLVSGLVIGFGWYPSLKKPDIQALKLKSVLLVSVLILGISFAVLTLIPTSDFGKYEADMEEFYELEQAALGIFNFMEDATEQEILEGVQTIGIPSWQSSLEIMKRVKGYQLPQEIIERNRTLKTYCDLRLQSYLLIEQSIREDSDAYDSEIETCNKQIDALMNAFN